jgi:hypothetical protein
MSFRDKRAKKNQDVKPEEEYNDATLDLLDHLGGFDTSAARTAKSAQTQVVEKIVEVERIVEVVPESALLPEGNTIRAKGYAITATGLTVIEEEETFEDWRRLGDTLMVMDTASQWAIGDWLNRGEEKYDQSYEAVAEKYKKSKKTLQNYVWVAQKMPFSLRRETLSFGHHMLVAGLEKHEDMTRWLDVAVENDWSIDQLRQAMQGDIPDSNTSSNSKTKLDAIQKLALTTSKLRDGALKAAKKPTPEAREQLRALATDQIEWWRKFSEMLDL